MSKGSKVGHPVTASDSTRDAVRVCYSDGDGYSISEVLHHCRKTLDVQNKDICYAPLGDADNHGIFTFRDLSQAILANQDRTGTAPDAAATPRFVVIMFPMVVHSSGFLVPSPGGTAAVSVLQAPTGWGRMGDAKRSQSLQGQLPKIAIVARDRFGRLFIEMSRIQRPQLLSPVVHRGTLEFRGSGHRAATLEETLTGPMAADA